jgi:hypothetical protein
MSVGLGSKRLFGRGLNALARGPVFSVEVDPLLLDAGLVNQRSNPFFGNYRGKSEKYRGHLFNSRSAFCRLQLK